MYNICKYLANYDSQVNTHEWMTVYQQILTFCACNIQVIYYESVSEHGLCVGEKHVYFSMDMVQESV